MRDLLMDEPSEISELIDTFGENVIGNPTVIPRLRGPKKNRCDSSGKLVERFCSACKAWRPIAEFYRFRSSLFSRSGYQASCKPCQLAHLVRYNQKRRKAKHGT